MLRLSKFLVFGGLILTAAWSQQSYPFFSPSPAPPLLVTAIANSPFGQSSYCYWVVVVYPIGKSTPSVPSCVPNAIETSSVLISWSAAQGASSYDVLRTTTPILPNVTSSIAVATAVSGTTQTDSFGALSSYTITSAVPATANLYLDNTAYSTPQLRAVVTGVGGTTAFNLSAGGGTPGGTSGQVQFNNTGAFGGFTVGGDATLNTGTGVLTVANGAITNAKLANSATTVNGATCTLGSTCAPYGGANLFTSAHTVGSADIGKLIVMNCSSACALTFESSPASTDWWGVESIGSTLATVALNGKNFNGSASAPVLVVNSVLTVASDGSNYFGGLGGLEIGQTVGNGGRATSILYADSNGALTQDQFFTFRSGSSGLSGYFVVNPSDNAFQDLADFQQRNSSGLSSQIAVFNAFGGSQQLRLGVNGNTASNCGGVANGNAYVCSSGGVLNLGSGSSTLKLDSNKHQISSGTIPTITSGFGGSTGRSIAGTDDVIRVTLGNNGTDTQGVVAFQNSYTNVPVCTADEENLHTPLGVTPTTSQVTVFSAAAFVSADTVGIFCKSF